MWWCALLNEHTHTKLKPCKTRYYPVEDESIQWKREFCFTLEILDVASAFTHSYFHSHPQANVCCPTQRASLHSASLSPRRCEDTGSSPACLWPPSIRPCRRRCSLPSNRPSSSRTTAAGNPRCLALMTRNYVLLCWVKYEAFYPFSSCSKEKSKKKQKVKVTKWSRNLIKEVIYVETRSLLYVWSVLWIWKMAYTRKIIYPSSDPRSHLPPGPGWPAPPVSSSPASDTPPDAASGRWLRPTDPPPSAAGPVAGGCRWARRPLLTRLESEPRRRRSACSLHCHWRVRDTRRQTVRQRHKATQSGAAGWDNHTGGGISSTTA